MVNENAIKLIVEGKKVAVLGIGISNLPLIRLLEQNGAIITAFDKKEMNSMENILCEFNNSNVKFSLGKDYLSKLSGFDIIFRTPGLRPDLPEIEQEIKRGAKLTSEMELFFDLCPAKIFGVTGSDGKTTTTTLVYRMLKEEGYNCWLGGNIGTPLLDKIFQIKEDDMVVLELSSFQLMTFKKSPNISIITNISPNHLDVHLSMNEYMEAKKNIFKHQKSCDKLIINIDNDITNSFKYESNSEVYEFSRIKPVSKGAFLKDNKIYYKDANKNEPKLIIEKSSIKVPGQHNIENFLAAISAVEGLVSVDAIKRAAEGFLGVEHRCELVREIDGVKFYNSSIDSSPQRTTATLKCFSDKVILIAGGKDKGIPYDELGQVLLEKVKCLILIGQTSQLILDSLMRTIGSDSGREKIQFANSFKVGTVNVICCKTYEDAVANAWLNASKNDCIILSPASTSFDMFNNFEERGRKFKEIVNKL